VRRRTMVIPLVAAVAATLVGGITAPPAQAMEGGMYVGPTPLPEIHGTPLAQIWRKTQGDTLERFTCTGSVISKYTILTAAHCFDPDNGSTAEYFVYTGDLRSKKGHRRNLSATHHYTGDLAIVINGDGGQEFNTNGAPYAMLPERGAKMPKMKDSFNTYGFGRTCKTCGPDIRARKASVRVNDNDLRTRGGPAFQGRVGGGHMWNGDSGGPVAIPNHADHTFEVFGINSKGYTDPENKDAIFSAITSSEENWLVQNGGMKHHPRRELRKRDLRVMPLGDSITAGFKSSTGNGYREPLMKRLTGTENEVDFVGSNMTGNMSDQDNEGHNGHLIDQVGDAANTAVPQQRPNVVLLHAGTNDMEKSVDPGGAPARLGRVIDDVLEDAPDATVIVATIVPASNSGTQGRIDTFNDEVVNLAQKRANAGKHVLAVSMNEVSTGDLSDGLHPNDNGYAKMAEAWYDGIAQADDAGWIKAPINKPSGGSVCNTKPIWHPQGEIASGGTPGTGGKSEIQFADLNGDGRDEYLMVLPNGAVMAYLNAGGNPGKPVWVEKGLIATGGGTGRVTFADLNGDGRAEYILVKDNTAVEAYLNAGGNDPGRPVWVPKGIIATGGTPGTSGKSEIQFADLNGDGRDDYLMVLPNFAVMAYLNAGGPDPGKPTWVEKGLIATGGTPGPGGKPEIQFADLNGDDRAEYLMVSPTGAVQSYLNVKSSDPGKPTWVEKGIIATGGGAGRVTFGDLNSDHRDDYLIVKDSTAVEAYLNGC
jgi:lysophospholipase L1-like esterase